MAPPLTDERYSRQPARAPPPYLNHLRASLLITHATSATRIRRPSSAFNATTFHSATFAGQPGFYMPMGQLAGAADHTRSRILMLSHAFESLELDDDTILFGVVRDPSQQQVFQDYGRFAALMIEGQREQSEDHFPQLVSFIGQTGAGKSTLIKILIERAQAESRTKLPSPVTSSANDRAFESTLLERILGWGAPSINESANQPTLPHAVIVLNTTEDLDDKEWDIKVATELLMEDVRSAVRQVPQVEEYARIWKQRGRNISSTHDLLKCYYASVSVVRVSARGRYMLMDEQIEKLFKLIQLKREASLLNKKRLRMLATAEKLQIYLQAAFDHFAQNFTVPFDFIKEALKHNPVPRDLGGNILKLALFTQENSPDQPHCNAAHVFTTMSPMLASCFHLDSVRQNLLGTTDRLLRDVYSELSIILEKYPLHYTETFWEPPWQINVKPHAGVRILCLDGGDLRGIVSLLVLRHIEKYLSPELPIQSFFDLIVGTSTGGIISLGLGINNWTVDDGIQTFRELCHRAFTPREMKGVPVLEHLAVISHGIMPENPMFSKAYRFRRAPQPDREMKVWEAARATAAAPPYFKPYEKPETKEMYLDGALYHNYAVWVAHQEKRLIWGDTGSGRLGDILNCNRIRESFLTENSQLHGRSIPDGEQRYVRINPDLGENVPRLDDMSMMDEAEQKTSRYLNQNRELVKETARRLIASTFFFETDPSRIKYVGNGFRCQGSILCRFVDRSDDLKALGKFLQAQVSGNFEPYFTIQEQGYASDVITVRLSEDTIIWFN
ncbi:hypothetical protein LZL87_007692 [Fusarium oxysporum]|nr:hypothetical protein LZL87_007692 [Fusarium oxysporum]